MPRPSTGSIRVLHVDGEPDFAERTATVLERVDDRFGVETATSASEGLDRLSEREFDCVVSDYELPATDGLEFLDRVREEHGAVPFVLFTEGGEDVASDAFARGVTGCLEKQRGTEQYELLADRIANAVEEYRAARRARDLDGVRRILHEVTHALVRAGTRDEIERRVCEGLTDAEPYRLAWIGERDPGSGTVEARTVAGTGTEFPEANEPTADGSETGPAGRAIRTHEMTVVRNGRGNDPRREAALERGCRSSAAVPLVADDELYGVLTVYAERGDAFDEWERDLLRELGADVAHAIRRTERRERGRALGEREGHLRQAQEIANLGSWRLDLGAGTLEWSDEVYRIFELPRDESLTYEAFLEYVHPEDREYVDDQWTAALDGGLYDIEHRILVDGTTKWVRERAEIEFDADGNPRSGIGVVQDVTEQKRRERRLERLHETTDSLFQADDTREVARIVVDAFGDILGHSSAVVRLLTDEGQTLRTVAVTDGADAILGDLPTYAVGEGTAGRAFAAGESLLYDDVRDIDDDYDRGEVRAGLYVPMGEYGTISITDTTPGAFDDGDVRIAELFAASAAAALERIERTADLREGRRRIEALHAATRRLMAAESREEVAQRTAEAAKNTLDYPFTVVRLLTDDDLLVPVAVTDEMKVTLGGERPTYEVGEETAGLAFAEGETLVYEDISELDDDVDRGDVRGVMYHPIGDYGVITIADGQRDAFDESDIDLAEILLANAEVAIRRLDHEREVTNQKERLEEFAGIVSHDLRNPLNVAEGRLSLAREQCSSDHLDHVADAHDRMRTLIADLLTLAKQGREVADPTPVSLPEVVRTCWNHVETWEATLVTDTDRTVLADRGRLEQLLENLVRNAVEHGGRDVTVTVGELADGFYVADDGPGIPDSEHDRVFETSYTTADEGSGLGLSIVEGIVDAHGWEVAVAGTAGEGARFEITGVDFDG